MKYARLLLVMALSISSFTASAQSSRYREDARLIVEATLPTQKTMDTVLAPFFARMRPRYQNIGDAQWRSITAEMRDYMFAEMNAPQGFIENIIGSYQRRLTEKEASEIAAFFRSEAGRKFVQQRDEVLVELYPLLNREVRRLAPKLDERLAEIVKRLGN